MELPTTQNVPVVLEVYREDPIAGSVDIIAYSPKERLHRGAKAWGLSWLAASACVFLPVLHFLLVPLGLALGPILFYVRMNQKDEIVAGTGACPKCKASIAIDRQPLQWPTQFSCPNCSTLIIATPASKSVSN